MRQARLNQPLINDSTYTRLLMQDPERDHILFNLFTFMSKSLCLNILFLKNVNRDGCDFLFDLL